MKKILLGLLIAITLFISGCSNTKSITNLKYGDFQKKIANKESFILEVMQDGCSHCENFTPKFDKILSEYNIKAYSINLAKMAKAEKKEFNTNYDVDGTPTVMFFKDGEETSILNRINGDKDRDTIITKLKSAEYIK